MKVESLPERCREGWVVGLAWRERGDFALEDVEADGAAPVDVTVVNLCFEGDFWWLEGIVLREV